MSRGAYALGDGWVLAGVALFAAVALLGEGVLWPAERRLQAAVAAAGPSTAHLLGTGSVDGEARLMVWSASAALVLLIAGMVVMVAQPSRSRRRRDPHHGSRSRAPSGRLRDRPDGT